jgi:hypothetical protein
MLIEVKTKVAWIIDDKIKKETETFILNTEIFAQAEYVIMRELTDKREAGLIDSFEIMSLKLSIVKEIITQYEGEYSYIASLKDVTLQDDGSEKVVRYKVLLWASSITDAMSHVREIVAQGYDMQVDGLKEVNYTYINNEEQSIATNENS